MKVGDLVKHKDFEQYGIVLNVLPLEQGGGRYFVILWAGRLAADWVWDDMVEKVWRLEV